MTGGRRKLCRPARGIYRELRDEVALVRAAVRDEGSGPLAAAAHVSAQEATKLLAGDPSIVGQTAREAMLMTAAFALLAIEAIDREGA